jgi:hypothetical protein
MYTIKLNANIVVLYSVKIVCYLNMISGLAESIRIPLSYGEAGEVSPYMHSTRAAPETTSIPIKWDDPNWLNIIHSSDIIEISSRGVRSIINPRMFSWWVPARQRQAAISRDVCVAHSQAFCWMGNEGGLLPSASDISPKIYVTGLRYPQFSSGTLATFSKQSKDACGDRWQGNGGGGNGRIITSNQSTYVISSCDILNGHLVITYEPALGEILIFSQTFGPMAYSIIILSTLVCLYGASGEIFKTFPDSQGTSALIIFTLTFCTTLSCSLSACWHGIPFATIGDESTFWASVFFGMAHALGGLFCKDSEEKVKDSCLYALATVSIALYRTPETPYAGILIAILTVKQWSKVISSCRGRISHNKDDNALILVWRQLDLLATTLYLCLLVEVGLVSQFSEQEDWPVYAGIGMYISFTAAWYQSSSSRSSQTSKNL